MEFGEIYRFVVHYEREGASAIQNVFHAEFRGDESDDFDFMTNLAFWLFDTPGPYDEWISIASSLIEVSELTGAVMNLDGTVLRNLPSIALAIPGGVLFDTMAAATSGQILFETTQPGTRGMKYVPGIADPRINLGLLDSTSVTTLVDFGLALLDIAGADPEVLSRLGVLSRVAQVFVPFIVSASSDTNPIYQRRRGPGRGL